MTRVEHSCVILGRANRELSTQMQSKIILPLKMAKAHAAAIQKRSAYSSGMPALAQASRVALSHTLA